MKPFLLWFALLASVLFVGCSATQNISREFNSAAEFEEYFENRVGGIKTFSGSGSLTIETPEFSNSANFKLNIKKPDSLRLELAGPFGISVGTLMMSRQNFVFFNGIENRSVKGKTDSNLLSSIINMPITFDEILNIFTGSYFYSATDYANAEMNTNEEYYLIRNNHESTSKEIWIDKKNLNVTKLLNIGKDRKIDLEATAKSYEKVSGIEVPNWVRIIFPKQKRSLTIAYDNIKVNQPVKVSE
ncbi:MAG: DUF4292 domain-containing protein [Bacteroidota bacterium]|nr:DUF4292 domain-containing protein [Bacteroidota bacterium]